MASNSSTLGYPVQIANIKKSKVYLDTAAFNNIMDKVGSFPMSVVSINGPLRSGKSYILGHIIRFLSAPVNDTNWSTKKLDREFHWKNSADRQTSGILMWSEPLFIERNGRKIAVLLVDTQGCFDEKTTTQENSAIFALSCLLSSVLIFNTMRQISEETLQFLQLFVGFAKATEDSEQSESFSKLIFLIRDWQFLDFGFGYHDDITSSGPKNFKKEKLDVNPGMPSDVRVVHQTILESFENVGCCLMPYPGMKLAMYDNQENLEPDFIKTIKDFVPRIFDASNICIKIIGGEEVNGNTFKLIVERWAKHFAKYELPETSNITEATAKSQNQMAHSIAIKFYRYEMSKVVDNHDGLSEEKMREVHEKNMKEAIEIFKSHRRIRHDDIQRRYMKDLEKLIQEAFDTYQKMNCFIRIPQESGKQSEAEMKQMKEEFAKEIKQLEISQEARTNIMTKQIGYFNVRIINETDQNITLYWENHHFWQREIFEIQSNVTKTCSFYAYDNLFWSTKYRAKIQYDNKKAEFWAFGEGAPREENTFTVKSDGVFLRDYKHSNWVDNSPPDSLDSSSSELGPVPTIVRLLSDPNIGRLLSGTTSLLSQLNAFKSD